MKLVQAKIQAKINELESEVSTVSTDDFFTESIILSNNHWIILIKYLIFTHNDDSNDNETKKQIHLKRTCPFVEHTTTILGVEVERESQPKQTQKQHNFSNQKF